MFSYDFSQMEILGSFLLRYCAYPFLGIPKFVSQNQSLAQLWLFSQRTESNLKGMQIVKIFGLQFRTGNSDSADKMLFSRTATNTMHGGIKGYTESLSARLKSTFNSEKKVGNVSRHAVYPCNNRKQDGCWFGPTNSNELNELWGTIEILPYQRSLLRLRLE